MTRSLQQLSLLLLLTTTLASPAVQADPPGRVGRVSLAQGSVSLQPSRDAPASAANVNWPITAANVLATGPTGVAEIRIGSSAIAIDRNSELEFGQFDDARVQLRVVTGSISLRMNSREQASEFVIAMPNGRVLLDEIGRYRFDVTPSGSGVTAFQGAARFETTSGQLLIAGGRRADVWAIDGSSYRVVEAYRDPFDEWTLGRDRRDEGAASVRYVSPETTGFEALDVHGDWGEVAEFGPVWTPRVLAADWAPYRVGRWAWVAPWGWTWIDQAPWGFAPFHYGRWIHHDDRWRWVPGAHVRRPVYAPALVGWIGSPRPGAGPTVGWFPLAPREVYRPAHPYSPIYVRNINITHQVNPAQLNAAEPMTVTKYRHASLPHAVTAVPSAVISSGQTVARAMIGNHDRRTLEQMPITHAAPVAPPRNVERQEGPRPEPARLRTIEPIVTTVTPATPVAPVVPVVPVAPVAPVVPVAPVAPTVIARPVPTPAPVNMERERHRVSEHPRDVRSDVRSDARSDARSESRDRLRIPENHSPVAVAPRREPPIVAVPAAPPPPATTPRIEPRMHAQPSHPARVEAPRPPHIERPPESRRRSSDGK